jgi:hypothetical protein
VYLEILALLGVPFPFKNPQDTDVTGHGNV